jgi:hypothetical protein
VLFRECRLEQATGRLACNPSESRVLLFSTKAYCRRGSQALFSMWSYAAPSGVSDLPDSFLPRLRSDSLTKPSDSTQPKTHRHQLTKSTIASTVESLSGAAVFIIGSRTDLTRVRREDITFIARACDETSQGTGPVTNACRQQTPLASPTLVAAPSNLLLRGLEVCAGSCWVMCLVGARPPSKGRY